MDGTSGGNGNFLCRSVDWEKVCFPKVIIPSPCTYKRETNTVVFKTTINSH